MVRDPSAVGACIGCHLAEAAATSNSLHTKLWGEVNAIEARCEISLIGSPYEASFKNRCANCHTTCGQCHVSRPNSVGGGFPKIGSYYSHRFRATPDMNEQCTACHGSRIGTDFKGELEGNEPDVHRTKGYKCEACHTKEEIHGDSQHTGEHYEHRYEVATMPRCENCHASVSNMFHDVHVGQPGQNLQCQVCHSQPYKNCSNCHDLNAPDNVIDPSRTQFKIAQNVSPYRSEYDYVVVRHVPVAPGTFDDWGLDTPGYLSKPTWVYASPHNILRWTPQTTVDAGMCFEACHNTPDSPDGYLLRESDLMQSDGVTKLPDYDANIGIVIPATFPTAVSNAATTP